MGVGEEIATFLRSLSLNFLSETSEVNLGALLPCPRMGKHSEFAMPHFRNICPKRQLSMELVGGR